MLVLSRKKEESVIIGDGAEMVVVMVVEIRGDKARLGFTAPKHVPVHRQEIYEAIHAQEKEGSDGGQTQNQDQGTSKDRTDNGGVQRTPHSGT